MLGDVCPTSHMYYRLRRSLMSTLELSRHDIAPAARLEDIVPRDRRRAVWRRLSMDGLELPRLSLPPYLEGIAHAALVLKVIYAGIWGLNVLVLSSLVPLSLLTWLATRPWATHIRSGPVTIRDAVIYLTPYRRNESHWWSHEEISTKVRLIVAESLGLPLDAVQPESRLIEDLGAS
jgi:hypothetical protein